MLILSLSGSLSCICFVCSLPQLSCLSSLGQLCCTTPGGALPTDALCLGPFSDSISGLFCFLSSLTCALFLTGFLPLFSIYYFPSLGVCMHDCMPMCVCPSPPTHRVSAPPWTRQGAAWLPEGRPAGVQPGAGAPSAHLVGSPGMLCDEKAHVCVCRGPSHRTPGSQCEPSHHPLRKWLPFGNSNALDRKKQGGDSSWKNKQTKQGIMIPENVPFV